MKRTLVLLISVIMLVSLLPAASAEQPVIGIAWCDDTDSEFYTNVCRAVEAAGGTYVMLPQIKSPDLSYDEQGKLTKGVDETGILDSGAAKYLRCNGWHGSNAEEAVGDVGLVIFPGGEDVSPSLYYTPQAWHGIESEKDYCAERDVSDYLTMSYCLDNDIALIGFCRGIDVLAVVSGAEIIQDIPSYFDEMSIEYHDRHRNEVSSEGAYRDYAAHSVQVDEASLLYRMVQTSEIDGCPSWHHQAVKNVDNTRLAVTGYALTDGIQIIEAIERTDKTFAVGLQFHPEAAVVKHLDNAADRDEYMDFDTAISIFEYLVQIAGERAAA